MLRNVSNSQGLPITNTSHILYSAYKALNPIQSPDQATRCRFGMFVRLTPGIASPFKDQVRVWYFKGDKYTDQEPKMLRNLLNHFKKNPGKYDRVIIYDQQKTGDEKEVLRIIEGTIERNDLHLYSFMLIKYALPEWLKK